MNKEYIYLPKHIQDLTNNVVFRIGNINSWIDDGCFDQVGKLVEDTLRVQQNAVEWMDDHTSEFSELGQEIINDEVKDVIKRTQMVFGVLWGVQE